MLHLGRNRAHPWYLEWISSVIGKPFTECLSPKMSERISEGKRSMLTSLTTLEERVNRGAQLLDMLRPGWAGMIDAEHIESACPVHSITGQLFGPDLDDQMQAVGINYDGNRPWEHCEKFAQNGFAVLTADVVEVPESIRTRIHALVAELSTVVGKDMSSIMSVPEAMPYPRDQDMVTQEAFTLELLWEKAVKARR